MAQDQRVVDAMAKVVDRPEAVVVEKIEDTAALPGLVFAVLEAMASLGGGLTGVREEDVAARLFLARLAAMRQERDAMSYRQTRVLYQVARQVSEALAVLEEHDLAYPNGEVLYPRIVMGTEGYKVLSFLRDREAVVATLVEVAADVAWEDRQIAAWEQREEDEVYRLAMAA